MNTPYLIPNIVAAIGIYYFFTEVWHLIYKNSKPAILKQCENVHNTSWWSNGLYWMWMLTATLFLPRPASVIAVVYGIWAIFALCVVMVLSFAVIGGSWYKANPNAGKFTAVATKQWWETLSIDERYALVAPARMFKYVDAAVSIPFLAAIIYYGIRY